MTLSHQVVHDVDDRSLSPLGPKQVQSADSLQRCLRHANRTCIQLHLAMIRLVPSLPNTVVLGGRGVEFEIGGVALLLCLLTGIL